MKYFIFIFFSIIFILGCGERKDPSASGKIDYVLLSADEKSADCDTLTGNCAEVKIVYPMINGGASTNAVNKMNAEILKFITTPIFSENKYSSVEEYINSFFKEYEVEKREQNRQPFNWYYEQKGKVIHNQNGIVSISFSEYIFTAGAHGNYTKNFINLSIDSGKVIQLDDIFIDNFRPELTKIAEKEFRTLKKITGLTSLTEAGFWFKDDKFYLNDNFAIVNQGLVFYFGPYEIAPYALGDTELIVPFDKINNLISEESIIQKML